MQEKNLKYAGFWHRFISFILDSMILLFITAPLLLIIFGQEYMLEMYESYLTQMSAEGTVGTDSAGSTDVVDGEGREFWPAQLLADWILPALFVLGFWLYKAATPGKMALSMHIVDASTGERPTTRQFIVRYVGYFISGIPLFMGFIWIAFDKRKQGWHDKLADTVVVTEQGGDTPVQFEVEQQENKTSTRSDD